MQQHRTVLHEVRQQEQRTLLRFHQPMIRKQETESSRFHVHSYPIKALICKYVQLQDSHFLQWTQYSPWSSLAQTFLTHLSQQTCTVWSPWGSIGSLRTPWMGNGGSSYLSPVPCGRATVSLYCFPKLGSSSTCGTVWKVDMLPYTNVKTATHSKEDQKVLEVLEQYPTRVDGVTRYACPSSITRTVLASGHPRGHC